MPSSGQPVGMYDRGWIRVRSSVLSDRNHPHRLAIGHLASSSDEAVCLDAMDRWERSALEERNSLLNLLSLPSVYGSWQREDDLLLGNFFSPASDKRAHPPPSYRPILRTNVVEPGTDMPSDWSTKNSECSGNLSTSRYDPTPRFRFRTAVTSAMSHRTSPPGRRTPACTGAQIVRVDSSGRFPGTARQRYNTIVLISAEPNESCGVHLQELQYIPRNLLLIAVISPRRQFVFEAISSELLYSLSARKTLWSLGFQYKMSVGNALFHCDGLR